MTRKKDKTKTFANAAPNTLFMSVAPPDSDGVGGSRAAADPSLLDDRPWGDQQRVVGRILAAYDGGFGCHRRCFDAFTSCRCAEVDGIFRTGWRNFAAADEAIAWLLGDA